MSGPWHRSEEAPDLRVKHPVHLLPENAGVEGVQRIVLAAPRPESVGEPEEVFLVDYFENRRDRLLDDQNLRHLLLELGIAAFQIVTHLMRLDFLLAENL